MAKSLSSILSQIERLQKEAAAIQSEVVGRIRSEIAKYGLTAEQLFGDAPSRKTTRGAKANGSATRVPKYADSAGNVWGGIGKRPEWLRQALAAGKTLEEFLVAKPAASAFKKRATRKKTQDAGLHVTAKPKGATKKRAAARKTSAPRKKTETSVVGD